MYDELIKRLRHPWGDNELISELTNSAANAIEQLSSAGSAYGRGWTLGYDAGREENKPRWIPVTERLPDFEGCVLCMRKAFVGDNLRYQDILYYEEGTFYMEFEDTPIPTEVITHWMPLPTPPKGE